MYLFARKLCLPPLALAAILLALPYAPEARGANAAQTYTCVSAPVALNILTLPTDPPAPTQARFDVNLTAEAKFTAQGSMGVDPAEHAFVWTGAWITLEKEILMIGTFSDAENTPQEIRGKTVFANDKGLRLVIDIPNAEAVRATCVPKTSEEL